MLLIIHTQRQIRFLLSPSCQRAGLSPKQPPLLPKTETPAPATSPSGTSSRRCPRGCCLAELAQGPSPAAPAPQPYSAHRHEKKDLHSSTAGEKGLEWSKGSLSLRKDSLHPSAPEGLRTLERAVPGRQGASITGTQRACFGCTSWGLRSLFFHSHPV